MRKKIVIIGAGPTGLGAAYRLDELGINDYILIEETDRVGGLAKSFKDEHGFTWDIGGHVTFSKIQYYNEFIEKEFPKSFWNKFDRQSWVYMLDRLIPYPFQNNIQRLDKKNMKLCLEGLENRGSSKPNNFSDWIENNFGTGISNIFMKPYNEKVWATSPKDMSFEWIADRVARVDIDEVKKNISENKDNMSWGPNAYFLYPSAGGTGAIWEHLGSKINQNNIRFNTSLVKVIPKEKKVLLSNGDEIEYEYIINTIPLTEFDKIVDLEIQVNELVYSSTNSIGIGLRGSPVKHLSDKSWCYFPESQFPFYRLTVLSNYSDKMAPDHNHYSLLLEVSERQTQFNSDELINFCIQSLEKASLINKNDEIVSKWHLKAKYGYPVPSLKRNKILKHAIPLLEDNNIFSRGRFGAWLYEISNQDHTFYQGIEVVNRIANGDSEEQISKCLSY